MQLTRLNWPLAKTDHRIAALFRVLALGRGRYFSEGPLRIHARVDDAENEREESTTRHCRS